MDKSTYQDENNVVVNIEATVLGHKKHGICYNPKMMVNRSIALCALSAYLEENWCNSRPLRCLDAFGATGVAGLSWAKNLQKVDVTINDCLKSSVDRIRENEQLNEVKVRTTQRNVDALLVEETYDFVFLQCYGSSVQYLSSLFKNIPKNGVVVITSTDEAALYGKAPDVTLRNYSGYVVKTFYYKELAARLIVACAAREAAKFNKGIEVMCCIAVRSHIAVVLRILKGHREATACVKNLNKVIHCCVCEDRAFLTDTIHPIEEPYSYLTCNCREKTCPKIACELGPVWAGALFNHRFCSAMLDKAASFQLPQKVQTLLQKVVHESDCTRVTKTAGELSQMENPPSKKKKVENQMKCPPFYYNLHKHSPKGYDLGKLNELVVYIRNAGYLASRTHFDPDAIRTSASLKVLKELLKKFCSRRQY